MKPRYQRRNRRKAEQLGMPFGTASARLKKNLVFHLAVKAGMHICLRCGLKITSAEELSLDHKIDWQDNAVDLFWDLENIGFSHRKCNKNRFHRVDVRNPPDGKSWCAGCRSFRHVTEFNKNRSRYNGLQAECKDCQGKRWKVYGGIALGNAPAGPTVGETGSTPALVGRCMAIPVARRGAV